MAANVGMNNLDRGSRKNGKAFVGNRKPKNSNYSAPTGRSRQNRKPFRKRRNYNNEYDPEPQQYYNLTEHNKYSWGYYSNYNQYNNDFNGYTKNFAEVACQTEDLSRPLKWSLDTNGDFNDHLVIKRIPDKSGFISLSCDTQYSAPAPLTSSPFFKMPYLKNLKKRKLDNSQSTASSSHDDGLTEENSYVQNENSTFNIISKQIMSNHEANQVIERNVSIELDDLPARLSTHVTKTKRTEPEQNILKQLLSEIIEEKLSTFLDQSHLTAIERRLSNLESTTQSSRSSVLETSEFSTEPDDSSSDESIEFLQEFPKTVRTNGITLLKSSESCSNDTSVEKSSVSIAKSKLKKKKASHGSIPQLLSEASISSVNIKQENEGKTSFNVVRNLVPFEIATDDFVSVYACGVSSEDRTHSGIGVWFADDHPLNVSFPFDGLLDDKILDITAAWIALKIAKKAGLLRLRLHTFSSYVIKCVQQLDKLKERKWKRKSGAIVKNKANLKKLSRAMSKLYVDWRKVPSNLLIPGADKARQLASSAVG